ncbi:hypothetical protein [Streptomyces kanasensis]|uniref:hypothetical protein n=1 Tax=Streptomyces kanasensis TaxID=936756 RepID=UPI00381AD0B3
MARPERHDAVGAFALGVLEPYDALCCAEHLTRCGACAARLAEFAEVARALAQLTGRVPLAPPPRRAAPRGVRPAAARSVGVRLAVLRPRAGRSRAWRPTAWGAPGRRVRRWLVRARTPGA